MSIYARRLLVTCAALAVSASAVMCNSTPVDVVPDPTVTAPRPRPGAMSLQAQNAAPVPVGNSVLQYADPSTGAEAVAVMNVITATVDGGTITAEGINDITGTPLALTLVPTSGETGRARSNGLDVQINGQDQVLAVTGTLAVTQSGAWTVGATQSGVWLLEQTDGVNGPVAVKPGFTPATTGDAAEVVSISPNSPLPAGANAIGSVTANSPSVVPVFSTALASCLVIKASPGHHISTTVQIDSTAPSGIYYVQMFNTTSCPANGTGTGSMFHAPFAVKTTNGSPASVVLADLGAQATFSTGYSVALSTTQFTLTGSAFLVADGSVQ